MSVGLGAVPADVLHLLREKCTGRARSLQNETAHSLKPLIISDFLTENSSHAGKKF
jgi:hypothetical protein